MCWNIARETLWNCVNIAIEYELHTTLWLNSGVQLGMDLTKESNRIEWSDEQKKMNLQMDFEIQ